MTAYTTATARVRQCVLDQVNNQDGLPPTVREIQRACGLSSTSVARYHLYALAEAGLITIIPKVSRGILPVR